MNQEQNGRGERTSVANTAPRFGNEGHGVRPYHRDDDARREQVCAVIDTSGSYLMLAGLAECASAVSSADEPRMRAGRGPRCCVEEGGRTSSAPWGQSRLTFEGGDAQLRARGDKLASCASRHAAPSGATAVAMGSDSA